MPYAPTPLVQRAWTNPPRCLAGFTVQPIKESASLQAANNDLAVFQVACPCGSPSLHILGHPRPTFVSTQCERCGCITPMFDNRKHGYDALVRVNQPRHHHLAATTASHLDCRALSR
jgi:hypothetical protein